MRSFCSRIAMAAALCVATSAALAQTKPVAPQPAPGAAGVKSQSPQLDGAELATLIKSTIMALQHANQTGNYSVLRDLGTPVFRERFDQTHLASIFANLRTRGINLSPAVLLKPNLLKQPELIDQNKLHIVGNFPTEPLQIQYELLFLSINGIWRIEGLSVDAVPVQGHASAAIATTPATPPAAAPSAPAPVQQAAPNSAAKPDKKPTKAQN